MSALYGSVLAVNADGTVSLDVQGEVLLSVPCAPTYSPRAVEDRVEYVIDKGLAWVVGLRTGDPADAAPTPWTHTLTDTAPPAPFVEVSSIYVDPDTHEVRYVWVTAPPPETVGTLTVSAVGMATYRGTWRKTTDYAEQGTWDGFGPDAGVFVYGAGAFASLAGKTITKTRLVAHRMNQGGTYGATSIHVGLHAYATIPAAPVSITGIETVGTLIRDETAEWRVPTAWGEALRDGAAAGLGIYHVSDNAQLDRLDILIDWSMP